MMRSCQLISAGTSVCGASAVIATNTVTDAHDEDVAYAVACVTVFGSIAMFAYPTLGTLLHLDPRAYGLWAGSSIHEIAQVVAAAFQEGRQAGEFGTIAKLSLPNKYLRDTADNAPETRSERMFTELEGYGVADPETGKRRGLKTAIATVRGWRQDKRAA